MYWHSLVYLRLPYNITVSGLSQLSLFCSARCYCKFDSEVSKAWGVPTLNHQCGCECNRWVSAKRRNSSALVMELRLSCTRPSISWCIGIHCSSLSDVNFIHHEFQTWNMFIMYYSLNRKPCQLSKFIVMQDQMLGWVWNKVYFEPIPSITILLVLLLLVCVGNIVVILWAGICRSMYHILNKYMIWYCVILFF